MVETVKDDFVPSESSRVLDPHAAVPLDDAAVVALRARFGRNEIPMPSPPGLVMLVVRQLRAPLVLVLILAGGATFALGRWLEGGVIAAIVVVNSIVGAAQARRADQALDALASLSAPTAVVRRVGGVRVLPAAELVPGDLIELRAGDRVPADARLLTADSLAVDEALLTGESFPAEKATSSDAAGPDAGLVAAGRVFAGTFVVRGAASACVTATGPETSMGRIAGALVEGTAPPLEGELRRLAQWTGLLAGLLGIALGVVTYLHPRRTEDRLAEAAISGIALAVAAIPEGMVAIVTMALALGAQRMARRGAIVRHLSAIEGLGSANVICTDKTGTLTTGRLEVIETVAVTDERSLAVAARRCNDASGEVGDPIDIALLEYARALVNGADDGERLARAPFDAVTRSMATVHGGPGGPELTVKGAPETVLDRCVPGDDVARLRTLGEEWSSQGRRVLAFATGGTADLDADGLTVLGLIAFADPLRPTARATIDECRRGSIRVVMVTGDHAETARSIAVAAGLATATVVTPATLVGLDPGGRQEMLRRADVVARVDPATKVELVHAHHAAGAIVAMTGDGVNDAPALRAADIGVAMGGGSDVAREASALVITDGDLGRLVDAIGEGRTIHRNLRAVVAYMVSGNLAEILLIGSSLAVFSGLGAPFLPVQLLWVNLITDGLPALALGADRPMPDPLAEPPRPRAASLVSARFIARTASMAALCAAMALVSSVIARSLGADDGELRAQLLLSLLVVHLALALIVRTRRWTFEAGWRRSRGVLGAVGFSLAIQVPAFAWGPMRRALALAPVRPVAWLIAAGAGVATVLLIDGGRAVASRRL